MTNKNIPETLCVRVGAAGVPYIEDTSDGNCHIGFSYIRADLIEAYAYNDELKDGQRRWVWCFGEWDVAQIARGLNGSELRAFLIGSENELLVTDPILVKWGPVIEPPDTAPSAADAPERALDAFDSLISHMLQVVV